MSPGPGEPTAPPITPADAADGALARLARDGDEAAFATLVERYHGRAIGVAYGILGDYDDAVDAAQQGFIQLFRSLPTLDLERPLRPWLFRTIRNRCIDRLRQRRSAGGAPGRADDDGAGAGGEGGAAPWGEAVPDPDPLPEEIVERADLQRLLLGAIGRLPARYREVVTLRYATDLTFAEIGAVLGVPENTAKIHFHRAKGPLREALRDLL